MAGGVGEIQGVWRSSVTLSVWNASSG